MVGERSGRGMIGLLARLTAAFVLSRFGSQKLIAFLARPNQEDLIIIQKLMEAGKVTPVVDRCYRLPEVPDAIRYVAEGHARGKVVISLSS
jgi:NADPH:quinone reductase-like Zn-dependent oxidoreductase